MKQKNKKTFVHIAGNDQKIIIVNDKYLIDLLEQFQTFIDGEYWHHMKEPFRLIAKRFVKQEIRMHNMHDLIEEGEIKTE